MIGSRTHAFTILVADDEYVPKVLEALLSSDDFNLSMKSNAGAVAMSGNIEVILASEFDFALSRIREAPKLRAVFLDKTFVGTHETGLDLFSVAYLREDVRHFYSVSKGFSLLQGMQIRTSGRPDVSVGYLGKNVEACIGKIREIISELRPQGAEPVSHELPNGNRQAFTYC